ncbi:hypothetical protein WJX73_008601 [Symbiochloris irregularis]|uniref:Uncharacterized protein n=1 Tax=Symbiochloris irregularis TaxID=706552 RepID=A0AAW1NVT0_9CHLO
MIAAQGGNSLTKALKLAQSLNYGSVGSFLSIGCVGSIASIGSTGSILSIGSAGSVLSIASIGGVGTSFAILGIFSFGGFNLVCCKDWPYGIGQLIRCMRGPRKHRKHV